MARPKNGPLLSKEQIVETALRLVEQEGDSALSMRRLARELKVNPMALYHHVPNRETLFSEVIETVSAELALPTGADQTWQQRILSVAHAYRRLALEHPAVFPAMLAHPKFVPSDLRIAEACLDVLAEVGLSPAAALSTLGTFQAFVEGFALDELTHGQSDARFVDLSLPGTGDFPRLEQVTSSANITRDEAFQFGLDVLIGGLERLVRQERDSPH